MTGKHCPPKSGSQIEAQRESGTCPASQQARLHPSLLSPFLSCHLEYYTSETKQISW